MYKFICLSIVLFQTISLFSQANTAIQYIDTTFNIKQSINEGFKDFYYPVTADSIPDSTLVGFSSIGVDPKQNSYSPSMPMLNLSQCIAKEDTIQVSVLSGMVMDGLIARVNVFPKDSLFSLIDWGIADKFNEETPISLILSKKNEVEGVAKISLILPNINGQKQGEFFSGMLIAHLEKEHVYYTTIFQCHIE